MSPPPSYHHAKKTPKRVEELSEEERTSALRAWVEEQKHETTGTYMAGGSFGQINALVFDGALQGSSYDGPLAPPQYVGVEGNDAGKQSQAKHQNPINEWLDEALPGIRIAHVQ